MLIFLSLSNGLTNFWPLDEDTLDTIGNSSLYGGVNVTFSNNRFNFANSSISFNYGFYFAPTGEYFNGDFTISVWVKLNKLISWARILDFGNNQADTIYLSLSNGSTSKPVLFSSDNKKSPSSIMSNTTISLGKWSNLVASLNGNNARMYIDSLLVAEGSIYRPLSVTRSSNYVGKSNWFVNENLYADLDELRIYNRALSDSEVVDLFKMSPSSSTESSYSFETTTPLTFSNNIDSSQIPTTSFMSQTTSKNIPTNQSCDSIECIELENCEAFFDNGTTSFGFSCQELCNLL